MSAFLIASPEQVDALHLARALVSGAKMAEPCFAVRRYLGSMLSFDFGIPRRVKTMRGSEVNVGSTTLGVRNVYWRITATDDELETSDNIGSVDRSHLDSYFINEGIRELIEGPGGLEFALVFGNGNALIVDRTNKYGAPNDDVALTLNFFDHVKFEMLCSGDYRLLLHNEFSAPAVHPGLRWAG